MKNKKASILQPKRIYFNQGSASLRTGVETDQHQCSEIEEMAEENTEFKRVNFHRERDSPKDLTHGSE